MIHLGTAFRAFFGTLFNDQKAALVEEALGGKMSLRHCRHQQPVRRAFLRRLHLRGLRWLSRRRTQR